MVVKMNDSTFNNAQAVDVRETYGQENDAGISESNVVDQRRIEELKWKELLRERRLVLAKDPRYVRLLNEVGEAAEAAGDIDRAIWAYKRAVRLDPHYAVSYRDLGQLYEKLDRKDLAREALQNYLNYAGGDADIELMLTSLFDDAGDDAEQIAKSAQQSAISKKQARKWEELGLTPGEAIYLLDPDNADGQEMMRYTLLDMIARGILELDDRYGVGRGEEYGSTELRSHEMLLPGSFPDTKIQLI